MLLRAGRGSAASDVQQASRTGALSDRRRSSFLLGACLVVACLRLAEEVPGCFLAQPAAGLRSQRGRHLGSERRATEEKQEKPPAGIEEGYEPYDWQKAASMETSSSSRAAAAGATKIDSSDKKASTSASDASSLGGLSDLPDLPFEPDLVPPEPKPWNEGGRDLFEWTGIWVTGFVLLGLIFGALSVVIAKAGVDAEFADVASRLSKAGIFLFQALFMGRIILLQFPKTKTTDLPWAFIHYPTEWILVPTRAVFPPEAGVDVSPIFWFVILAFSSEFLNGPAGVFTMIKEGKLDVITGRMS
mmetsp:Transcript_30465/g.71057  ORF Transcript_30465/g.71057 Transcript_30465/m.71057 type:complete len:302 (-) Transcript_30465:7-912(-)